ncbi:MAG TPA: class I SAM-dependent methyltransferase [Candidatus Binatia bacterium]|jgi:hypothetical protein|nr:class I SAM-dependent methyltransferase [Candidatus Binatia bacterium]
MPSWLIKTAAQRVMSWLPNPYFWNGLLQACLTKSTSLSRTTFERKVSECNRHLQAFRSFQGPPSDFTAYELGTGWFPIIPIGLYLCGAQEVWTIDIADFLRPSALRKVAEYYCECAEDGLLQKILPGFQPERLKVLENLMPFLLSELPVTFLARLKLRVIVGPAQATPIPSGTVNLFLSSGVLEYIPPSVLREILVEARRTAVPGAIMSHRLNLADAFSYFDRRITPFNFLRYSAKQWRWLDSPLISQNRLRISDYRTLFRETGFEIVREESNSGSPNDLRRIKLAPEFQHYKSEDLLVIHSFLTCLVCSSPPA